MAAESTSACPICLDDFRNPKLLHCAHTFCRACLVGCIDADVGITCPICRITTLWRKDGLDGLPNNYFVPDTIDRRRTICQKCGSDIKVRTCITCEEVLCLNCRSMHACVWIVDKSNNTEADTASYLLSLNVTPGKFKTVFRATLLSEVVIDLHDCTSHATGISAIIPINEKEAWVVASNGSEVMRYDMLGNIKERHHLGEGIVDGALNPDGRLYVLCLSLKCVLFLENHKWHRFVGFTENVGPRKLSTLSNGKVVLIMDEECDEDDYDNENSEESTDKTKYSQTGNETLDKAFKRRSQSGAIVVLDNHGRITGKFSKEDTDFRPCDVVCCPSMDSICICDAYNGAVDIILSDGTLLGTYQGGNLMSSLGFLRFLSPRHIEPFEPEACACDSDGNFYIVDRESKLIHVISPTANLLGVVAADALTDFGIPLPIAMDKGGKLWTGNDENGIVRVFFVTQFLNDFQKPPLGV
ncbi:hypothetical protein FSP39_024268 [Pinctada imbricata]|uniref:RING-type domain-containing protein n=1 Tax=Pinctada imbricata TaxID=66713 RepID=A0AA89BVG0_PINIB|nr:hypothetical protein FSP39_024268 [Pinctada imbricata]